MSSLERYSVIRSYKVFRRAPAICWLGLVLEMNHGVLRVRLNSTYRDDAGQNCGIASRLPGRQVVIWVLAVVGSIRFLVNVFVRLRRSILSIVSKFFSCAKHVQSNVDANIAPLGRFIRGRQ